MKIASRKCVLPAFDGSGQLWPPSSASFAANFAASLSIPAGIGPAWTDPVVRNKQRAEHEAERQRLADFHEQAARDQEERINKEERQRFART